MDTNKGDLITDAEIDNKFDDYDLFVTLIHSIGM